MDILRLLRWCRFISPEALSGTASAIELGNLSAVGYIKRHKGSGAYILTSKGNQLLEAYCEGQLPLDTQRSYRDTDIQRRLHISDLVLTAYRAGTGVFTVTLEDLREGSGLFLPSNSRGRGSNPWANTRIAALLRLGNTKYAAHYIRAGIGRLLFADELASFSRNTACVKCECQALLFFGSTYSEILDELDHPEEHDATRLISYGEAYRRSPLPVHLLTCDHTGVLQMRLMAEADYRSQFTKILLNSKYEPPPEGYPSCDAVYGGVPFVMAVDMDLRRIDAAIQTANDKGYRQPVIAALPRQADDILYARYRDTGKAQVITLKETALTAFLRTDTLFYSPSRMQFLTEKGEVIDAPPIKIHRKA